MKKLSILVPAYNEAKTIALVLGRIAQAPLPADIEKEVVVVNDCSTDETDAVIREYVHLNPALTINYIQHEKNQGKGAALHTAIRHANGDYIIVQDADLEYDPREYALLLQPVIDDHADVVYGSRFMGGKPHRILFFWHTIGNKFLTLFSNLLTNLNLTDIETCYKLFRADILKNLNLQEQRFGFEPEVTAKMSRVPNIRVYEVGISYYGRTYAEGKKIGWKDGVRTLWCIVKYNVLR